MKQYLELLEEIRDCGVEKTAERTGTGTLALFAKRLEFDLTNGFPIITTKKMFFRGIVEELLWMVSGSSNIQPLILRNINIWNEWAFQRFLDWQYQRKKVAKYSSQWNQLLDKFVEKVKKHPGFANKWGNLGPVYGYLWRNWRGYGKETVDQLANVIETIKTNPDDRRMVVTAWDPSSIYEVALPPCHILYQFYVAKGKLSLQMYQRSADSFLGLPFNITQYALLLSMVVHVTQLIPETLTLILGDTHLYLNHLKQVNLQLSREPKPLPPLIINPQVENLWDFQFQDFELVRYDPHPAIKAPISV